MGNGSRVLFRYYKFLLRGCSYADSSLEYVAQHLLHFWMSDEKETINIGRIALGNLVGSSDTSQLERLHELVFKSFNMAMNKSKSAISSPKSQAACLDNADFPHTENSPIHRESSPIFLSASSWWKFGWLNLLQVTP